MTYQSVFYFDRKNNHFDSFDCQDDESLLMFYSKKNSCLLVHGNDNSDCFETVVVDETLAHLTIVFSQVE